MGLISNRYAKAWLDFATEKSSAEMMYGKVRALLTQLDLNPEVLSVMENPAVTSEQKVQLLLTAAGDTHEVYQQCIRLLEKNNRLGEIGWIGREYLKLYRKENKLFEVIITSAAPLEEKVATELKQWVSAELDGQVELIWKENPVLIGGFVLEVEGKRWDASIKNQLEVLRKNLSN